MHAGLTSKEMSVCSMRWLNIFLNVDAGLAATYSARLVFTHICRKIAESGTSAGHVQGVIGEAAYAAKCVSRRQAEQSLTGLLYLVSITIVLDRPGLEGTKLHQLHTLLPCLLPILGQQCACTHKTIDAELMSSPTQMPLTCTCHNNGTLPHILTGESNISHLTSRGAPR